MAVEWLCCGSRIQNTHTRECIPSTSIWPESCFLSFFFLGCHTKDHQVMCAPAKAEELTGLGGAWVSRHFWLGSHFSFDFFANRKIFVSRFHTIVVTTTTRCVALLLFLSLCYGRVAIRTSRPVSSFSISCNAVDNQKRYGPKTFSSDFVSIFCVRIRVILFFLNWVKKIPISCRANSHGPAWLCRASKRKYRPPF
jgi:hypothetical protein